ncbi:MAG: hypothetical protein A3F42_05295 [Gammaproteobacteria bacterium RIFCSPHIGHO2_12_FULL_37_34]|nr:MAG: hypothetical protein A3F42_05295 [Gammaproteobacteria bacterium RIFCSPHIGHO2_12_FULL_37_34]HLB43477.1 hypothetical protein [Gammaproteobacteria bacterium]
MKFRKTRVVASTIVATSLFSISLLANAADLTFANDTNVDLTVRINNVCSTQFGVIEQHTEKVITETNLQEACKYNQSNCSIQVFNTANCTGTHIETIVLNTSNGIVSLEGGDNDGQGNKYYWKADSFNLYVSSH